jgi:hypothetical protein
MLGTKLESRGFIVKSSPVLVPRFGTSVFCKTTSAGATFIERLLFRPTTPTQRAFQILQQSSARKLDFTIVAYFDYLDQDLVTNLAYVFCPVNPLLCEL